MAEPARVAAHPYGEIIEDIIAVGKRKQGWNTYGADPVGERAQLRAIELVNSFAKLRQPVPRPAIGASADGGIALRWLVPDREIEIQFIDDGGEAIVALRSPRRIAKRYNVNDVDVLKDVIDAHVLRRQSL